MVKEEGRKAGRGGVSVGQVKLSVFLGESLHF